MPGLSNWITGVSALGQDIYAELKESWGYRIVNALYLFSLGLLKLIDWFIPVLSLKIHNLAPAAILSWQSWLIVALMLILVGTIDGARRLREKQSQVLTVERGLQAVPLVVRANQAGSRDRDVDEVFQENATGKLEVAIVEITNSVYDVNIKASDVKTVKAQIFYREIDGTRKLDVIGGAWLESTETWVDFRVGQPLRLIVAIKDDPGACFAVRTDYEESTGFQEHFTPKLEYLEGTSHKVMIQLIADPKDERLVGRFTFKLTTKPLFQIEQI